MKAFYSSTIFRWLGLALFFSTALPASGVVPEFVGEWGNKDLETRGHTRIQIRSSGDRLVVHRWGRCHPVECDGGEAAATQGPTAQSLSLLWEEGFATVTEQLTLLADGNLEVLDHTHFNDRSGRTDYDSKETFVKGLVHDWSDNGTGAPTGPGPTAAPVTPPSVPPPTPATPTPATPTPATPTPATPTPATPTPATPTPKQKPQVLGLSAESKYPDARFRFRTTVAAAPSIYLSEERIDPDHVARSKIIARMSGPVGTDHDIVVHLPKAKIDKKYYFVVMIDEKPMIADGQQSREGSVEVLVPRTL